MKKLLVVAAALCLLATSAYAAEWNFYGSARVSTLWSSTETPPATTDVDTLQEWLQTNARIGANVKVSDSLTGRFEYGSGVNVRLLFGEWNFGAGKLLIGQDYTPILNIISSSIYSISTASDEVNLFPFGAAYSGREAQVKLTFGNFQIAMLAPNTTIYSVLSGQIPTGTAGANQITSGNLEAVIPAFEAGYKLGMDNWKVWVNGGWQTFDVRTSSTTAWEDVTSYVLSIGGSVSFGPVTLSGTGYYGQNAGNMIVVRASQSVSVGNAYAYPAFMSGQVIDNETTGYNLMGSVKANDMITLEAGIGGLSNEYDTAGAPADDVLMYYLNATLTLAPGVSITPEVGYVDYKEALQDEVTYFGIKWQINF